MIPEHSNLKSKDRISHAPYNFIPLPEKVVTVDSNVDQDAYSTNQEEHTIHTGYIECKMTTETPLYIRCPMSTSFFSEHGDKKFYELDVDRKNERARFFHLENKNCPVIPGSSLRGMVRTLVEIAGYGKMQWVSDKNLVYRAVGDTSSLGDYYRTKLLGKNKINDTETNKENKNNVKYFFDYPSANVRAGYLKKKGSNWYIQPARKINGETFVHIEYNVAQTVNCGKRNFKQGYNKKDIVEIFINPPRNRVVPKRSNKNLALELAVVHEESDISQNKKEGFEKAVIVRSGHMGGKTEKHMHCAIYEADPDEELILIPNQIQSLYSEDKDISRGFPSRPLTEDGDPLFYLVDENENLVFFGPTMMFRLPYDESIISFVPEELRKEDEIDIAEAIFGYTHEKNSLAGRISFTDARVEPAKDGIWLTKEPIHPKILSSPKPTCFQHYLVQDSKQNHNPNNKFELAHYATPSNETVIRGHKMYWNRGEVDLKDIKELDDENIENSKSHTKIRPIKPGITFSFRIYFENLRDFELGAILWVLTIPGKKETEYRHKLGMGKPYGMGTVKILSELYKTQRTERYQKLFEKDSWFEAVQKVPEESRNSLIKTFEEYVLVQIKYNTKVNSFSEIKRIEMLLKMMEWEEPSTKLTEYLQINEFRQRPVLPDPLNIRSTMKQKN
ncbi:MAG: TIGR03986 family CRISPR-associated RAMP protein [Methanosarcina mazei]|nr:TIGR03986 family CRISPR-associated RAMP protein [Methanosarcina mazei]